jgi:carbon dioxide concentrating mechanism protein CcmO
VSEALGLLEILGLTPSMVALDAAEKAARVEVLQSELNDQYGVCLKFAGPVADVRTALAAGQEAAEAMGARVIARVIPRVDEGALGAILSPPEFNPLIQQDVVFEPKIRARNRTALRARSANRMAAAESEAEEEGSVSQETGFALGFIETQGFTAVFAAVDTACKAANVEIVAKEKLGGGFVTIVIKGDVASVKAAVEAGKAEVESLGKLIAAHVIPRPSPSVLGLLP